MIMLECFFRRGGEGIPATLNPLGVLILGLGGAKPPQIFLDLSYQEVFGALCKNALGLRRDCKWPRLFCEARISDFLES